MCLNDWTSCAWIETTAFAMGYVIVLDSKDNTKSIMHEMLIRDSGLRSVEGRKITHKELILAKLAERRWDQVHL